jgi:hypothetical protein
MVEQLPTRKIKSKKAKRRPYIITKPDYETELQEIEAYDKHASNIKHRTETILEYEHMLLHHDAPVVRMPLLQMGRSHVRKAHYRVQKSVNANGNLVLVFTPSSSGKISTLGPASPVLFSGNANYDPNITTNLLAGGGNWDTGFQTAEGMGLIVDQFNQVVTIAAHLCISISGVSNLNKKGKIYLAERNISSNSYGDSGDVGVASNLVNTIPLSNVVKLDHFKEIEVMNMDSNSTIKYNYIPDRSYANMVRYDPAPLGTSADVILDGNKQFIFIIAGADATTQIIADYTVVLQGRPQISQLNNYPTDYSYCYKNPDKLNRRLDTLTDAKIVIEKDIHEGYANRLYGPSTGLVFKTEGGVL